jgi:hypothetical protein
MKRMVIVLTLLLGVALGPALAQNEERKSMLFDQLMKVMGGAALVKRIHEDLIKSLPPDQAARLARAFDPEEVLAVIRPIYLKYLSEYELRAIIHFYQSPAGRRLLSIRPQLSAEVMAAIAAYTRRKLGLAPAAPPAPAPPPPATSPAPAPPQPDSGTSPPPPPPTGSSAPPPPPPPANPMSVTPAPPPPGPGSGPVRAPDGSAPAPGPGVKPPPSSEVLSPPLR